MRRTPPTLLPLLFLLAAIRLAPTFSVGEEPEASPAAPARAVWDATSSVGRVVAEVPETARIFELVGIDYCCGGERTLAQAAREKDLEVDRLLAALLVVAPGSPGRLPSFVREPLPVVIAHVVSSHHAFLRRELPRLGAAFATVARVHGEAHPELLEARAVFEGLVPELMAHLRTEEEAVFPRIRALTKEERVEGLADLLDQLEGDHAGAGNAIHRLRDLLHGYAVPADACALYRVLLDGLTAFERDMLAHVHLENSVLIPRARALLGRR